MCPHAHNKHIKAPNALLLMLVSPQQQYWVLSKTGSLAANNSHSGFIDPGKHWIVMDCLGH